MAFSRARFCNTDFFLRLIVADIRKEEFLIFPSEYNFLLSMLVTASFGSFLLFILESQAKRPLLCTTRDVLVLLIQVFDSNSFHHLGLGRKLLG